MITSLNGRVADDNPNFIHGCFTVRVGDSFRTFKDIMTYALADGSGGDGKIKTGEMDPRVKEIFDGASFNPKESTLPVYFSRRKCRDSSLGGNDSINPLPQFSVDDDFVDIEGNTPFPHLAIGDQGSFGMGQVYSENFDDHQQILYMSLGIPVFSNLGNFWTTSVDKNLSEYMNKGTTTGLLDKIGYLLGATPVVLINMATIPYKFIMATIDPLQRVPVTKYYAFSNQMPMYFRFVNTILVMLATNMNIMGSSEDVPNGPGPEKPKPNESVTGGLKAGDTSGISTVFKDSGLDMAKIMLKRYFYENGKKNNPLINSNTDDALFKAADEMQKNGVTENPPPEQSTNAEPNPTNDNNNKDFLTSARNWTENWVNSFASAYKGTIYDGHLFIGFRIEKGLGASESFSNSTGESQVSQTANSSFQQANDINFSSGKNGIIETLLGPIRAFITGASDTFNLDPLAAVASGAAKIAFPEVWTDSSYSRSASFTISCLSPYGDFESIFQSEYVPLACMLAGTLPRGTGYSSHTAPFICQAYCRGIFSSPLCMIESLQVTRGADQFGFNQQRLPLKLTMNVTLKDLTPVMYMSMGGLKDIAWSILGTDDNFGEYMLTLSGIGLRDRLSPFRSIRRKTKILLSTLYKNKLSPFMLGMEGGSQFLVSRLISTIVSSGRNIPRN